MAYYPLDGDAQDLSGNCLHGVVYGSQPIKGIAKNYKAMSFDGKNDFIEIPNNNLLNFETDDDYSLSLWVKVDDIQNDIDTIDNDILSKWVLDDKTDIHLKSGYPFTVRTVSNKRNKFTKKLIVAQFGGYTNECGGNTNLSSSVALDGTFKHMAFIQKSGKHYLYIEGKLVSKKGSDVFCSTSNDAPLRLGKRGGKSHQNHFSGAIDNLSIYRRALTSEEVNLISDPAFNMSKLINQSYSLNQKLILADTLYFDYNTFELNSAQQHVVEEIYKSLKSDSKTKIKVIGHTNGIPSDEYCDKLSIKRAKVVESYLYKLGIKCNDISTMGMGKRQLIDSDKTPQGRKKNQRVEILLYAQI